MTCPLCGRQPAPVSAFDLVVRGDGAKAPRLDAAWAVVRGVLCARDQEHPSLEFGRVLADVTGVSESSIRNLLLAAQRHGLVVVAHRHGGAPRRVRAYVRWSR